MTGVDRGWWTKLRVQQKVWTLLIVVFVPLVFALVVPVYLIGQLQTFQRQHQQIVLAREQVQILRRLAVDIEDSFRGYLLTGQEEFLKPLEEAEPKVKPTVARLTSLVQDVPDAPGLTAQLRSASDRLEALLRSKHALIAQIRSNRREAALQYVRSGQGLVLSDTVRDDLRKIEDALQRQRNTFDLSEADLVRRMYWVLMLVVGAALALASLHTRLLSRSITNPIAALQGAVERLSETLKLRRAAPAGAAGVPPDEIQRLTQAFDDMAERIRTDLREREALSAISHEINSIGADGLHGVLRRITDGAVELLHVDVCLVMLRNDPMGCWIVEAASGQWHDRLHNTVMLWEEFPVSVQAFETRQPAVGENLHRDQRVEVRRRNLIGRSMLAVPLLAQGKSFGVLTLLQDREVSDEAWNVSLARGFANEAAIAISNARLYDAVYQKERRLECRLQQLEHMAETVAHDMQGPGERLGGLANSLLIKYGDQLDDRARRWLHIMDEEGKELSARIDNILHIARIGARAATLEAVDPAIVIGDVLKQRAGELERQQIKVQTASDLPKVGCHRDYLRQVFDNLIANAIKYANGTPHPEIRVTAQRRQAMASFSVSDNGPGIAPALRDRVFEPFVRLRPDSTKGSGIGLTIVKRIVEMYGGQVWVEPQERPGCTVTFTLPLIGELDEGRPDGQAAQLERQHHAEG
ncbi:MAG: CHASE3 domain-containing protein [Nitrospirota bacterium]|nr:CHASE3 domain-containing protein [Nitrospirota bacterium]